jgi:hypothetical protein
MRKTQRISTIPEFCDHMTWKEFVELCQCGGIIDWDGSGYWATESIIYRDRPVYPSDVMTGRMGDPFSTHVVWFNK